MIYTGGGPGANGRPLTGGSSFGFDTGDIIKIKWNQTSKEVRFEKNEKEWCLSILDLPIGKQDSLYPYAVCGFGTSVEICSE